MREKRAGIPTLLVSTSKQAFSAINGHIYLELAVKSFDACIIQTADRAAA